MSQSKIKKDLKFKKWIFDINDKFLKIKNGSIYCKACNNIIGSDRKSLLAQHVKTVCHRNNSELNIEDEDDQNIASNFNMDLCRAMIAVNLPWKSLNNKIWRNFLGKYMKRTVPDESTMRKNYLEKCYQEKIEEIRNNIKDGYIWISVDETTDHMGRYIANFIVGKLDENEVTVPYLLTCKELDRTNYASVSRFINTSMLMLWPSGGNSEKVLLLVTDAAAYMIKAGEYLEVFYPNMQHLTCLAHGINRIAEKVRTSFPLVNQLISSTKKVFLKSPSRISIYKEIMSDQPLPPQPVITRWGTWIRAAIFYADNFEKIKEVLQLLDPSEAASIREAQKVIQDPQLFHDLIFVRTYFSSIPTTISLLETRGMRLTDSMQLVLESKDLMENIPGVCGIEIREKFNNILNKNPAFGALKKLSAFFSNAIRTDELQQSILVDQSLWSKFLYAPITSCDNERSFSAYKQILADNRKQASIYS